jgi:hypothetical protein
MDSSNHNFSETDQDTFALTVHDLSMNDTYFFNKLDILLENILLENINNQKGNFGSQPLLSVTGAQGSAKPRFGDFSPLSRDSPLAQGWTRPDSPLAQGSAKPQLSQDSPLAKPQLSDVTTSFTTSFDKELFKREGENTPIFFSQNNSEDEHEHEHEHKHEHKHEDEHKHKNKRGDDDDDDDDDDANNEVEIHSPRSQYEIHNEIIEIHNSSKYKELTFEEVEKSIEKYYDCDMKYLNEFDLLVTYLNGQKHLFSKGQKLTQTKLNMLIVPSLVMSATITLFLPISSQSSFWFTTLFVSFLNATITLFISLVNYYKLESKQELFGHVAKDYENLKSSLEIKSNKLLFIDKKSQYKYISEQIKKMEKKINCIKGSSSIFLPSELNKLFPVIYHINIFSVLKKIENYRTNLIHKFRDIKNEIRFILYKRKRTRLNQKFIGFNDTVFPERKNDSVSNSLKKRLDILIQAKEIVRKQIVSYKNSYYYIDSIFNQEIKYADSYRNFFLLFSWFYFLPIGKNTNTSTFDMNKLTENEICNNNFL